MVKLQFIDFMLIFSTAFRNKFKAVLSTNHLWSWLLSQAHDCSQVDYWNTIFDHSDLIKSSLHRVSCNDFWNLYSFSDYVNCEDIYIVDSKDWTRRSRSLSVLIIIEGKIQEEAKERQITTSQNLSPTFALLWCLIKIICFSYYINHFLPH